MDWNDVRHFLALARLRSVRAAGDSLGVSHSTVARRVEALEEKLSARLFDRSRGGYALTDAGHQMLPGAERVEREMAALERGLIGQDERLAGIVSITCCDNYVADLLICDLAPFCDRYPEIELKVVTDSRSFDLSQREADIAVRILGFDAQPPEYLIGQCLAPVTIANYVAIEHEARLDPEFADSAPRWVSFDERSQHEMLIGGSSYPSIPAWGTFGSLELIVRATRRGLGLAMLPTYVGDQEPTLRRLEHPDLRRVANIWILSHPDLRENARFRAARTCLIEALKKRTELFEGHRPIAVTGRPKIATH
ncbi:MAG: DNA-binding transcriptional LysR family regulator [Bradymonadia bacterium]|jgi:DNA-binding transcriptional LysR family regulator